MKKSGKNTGRKKILLKSEWNIGITAGTICLRLLITGTAETTGSNTIFTKTTTGVFTIHRAVPAPAASGITTDFTVICLLF